MECPLCRKAELRPLYKGVADLEHGVQARADFSECPVCRALAQVPAPTPEAVRSFYPADYGPYLSEGFVARLKGIQGRRLAKDLAKEFPDRGTRLVELGCGAGHLLRGLKALGYRNIAGFDWHEPPLLKRDGIPFTAGDLESAPLGGPYDGVLANNVLEHLLDPGAFLARLKGALAPGGRVFIRTPNADAVGRSVFGAHWSGLHAPRHLYVFTPPALEALARRAGFVSVAVDTTPDSSSWSLSLQNALRAGGGPNAGGVGWPALLTLPFFELPALAERAVGRGSSLRAVLS
ncbi:MAG: class I SAM-dependent methyltransferase [Elusimicrobia bacterium]|nr:class I SAM-dependent methyltransferase [Elusimicrobiota bacterium]